jgi:hypothetical protein
MVKALADFFAEVLEHGALRFSGGSATRSLSHRLPGGRGRCR